MFPRKSVAGFALLASLACISSQAQTVRTDYDRKTDFSHFHTFTIYKIRASDGIYEKRLHDDIEAAMTQRGYQEVQQGADLAIMAVGNVQAVTEYTSFYGGLGPGWGWGWRGGWGYGPGYTSVQNIPVGTLILDAFDNRSHQLVFRGMATSELSKNSDKNVVKTEKSVQKIVAKLPNKLG